MTIPVLARMTTADVDDFMIIERLSFHQPWSRHMYLMDLTTNRLATYLVLRPANGEQGGLPPILAYGGFWLMVGEAHIATIASHPEWRGCGLGHRLLIGLMDEAVEQGAERATLEVRPTNTVARQLYEQMGYQLVGRRRQYYQDGEDALLMTTPPLPGPEMKSLLEEQRAAALARLEKCFGGNHA